MGVIALMKASPSGGWGHFRKMLGRVYPKANDQLALMLQEDDDQE